MKRIAKRVAMWAIAVLVLGCLTGCPFQLKLSLAPKPYYTPSTFGVDR